MFIPNASGRLSPMTGRNRAGEPTFGPAVMVPCGIVRLERMSQKSSVRADSSASRGTADELAMKQAKILFPKTVKVGIGDRFQIASYDLQVMSREPRLSLSGQVDHFECELAVLEDEGDDDGV